MKGLVLQLIRRDVLGRYRGSLLGIAWSFLNPIFMLIVYTFVFSEVFGARWGRANETTIDFGLILFVGLIVYGIFAECVMRAPMLVVTNASYVKKIIFPLHILPLVPLGTALFHGLLSFVVLLIALAISGNDIHVTVLLFPIVILPLCIVTLGASWVLASLGVYARDISQTVGILTTTLLFLSPVFYPASALPKSYQGIFALNPLTFVIEQAREVSIWGRLPDWQGLIQYSLMATLFALAGYWWFQKTRSGFADVL